MATPSSKVTIEVVVEDPVVAFVESELAGVEKLGIGAQFYRENRHIVVLSTPIDICDSVGVQALRAGHPNIRRRRDLHG